jgi:hypothetical protein
MKPSIYVGSGRGVTDEPVLRPILVAINFKKSKAFKFTKARAVSAGLTPAQIKKFIGA